MYAYIHCLSKLPSLVITALHPKSSSATSSVFNCSQPNVWFLKSRFFRVNNYYYQFVPIAIETLGPVGVEATAFFQDLGCRMFVINQEPRTLSFLWQQLSVAVQRGNAACILGTEKWSDDETLFVF